MPASSRAQQDRPAAEMTPLGHELPADLAVVPVLDMAPSPVVVAWPAQDGNPLVRSFVQSAVDAYQGS
ncbi:MAG: hypothetical protein ACJ786_26235 [Catenulispora sp.]